MEETKMSGGSKDIISENVIKIKKLFPEIVIEDNIDFEKLKLLLGKDIETENERYNFSWPGKNQAIKESQRVSYGTLRPYKNESKNWETTKNLYIEGDNLEVLKLLQKGYYKKIKMILIDPPYNTGNEFVYPDDYKD
ncbi:MAG: DNA methyltransferase, partial [Methanobrevibacter olleyae]|nr:DNA methyltransferase [Methanobrevibacter olleyae]